MVNRRANELHKLALRMRYSDRRTPMKHLYEVFVGPG